MSRKIKIEIEETSSNLATNNINEIEITVKTKISPKQYELLYNLIEDFNKCLPEIDT